MMLFFTLRNVGKLVKNIKRNYFTIKVSVIKIDNDFNHRNVDRVSEPLKFRRYLYFRQVVRSSKCLFGKMSVRQNVRRQNVRSAKCPATEKPNFDVYPSLDTCRTYFSDNCITTRNRLSISTQSETVEKI
jgi:hypothetical protein